MKEGMTSLRLSSGPPRKSRVKQLRQIPAENISEFQSCARNSNTNEASPITAHIQKPTDSFSTHSQWQTPELKRSPTSP